MKPMDIRQNGIAGTSNTRSTFSATYQLNGKVPTRIEQVLDNPTANTRIDEISRIDTGKVCNNPRIQSMLDEWRVRYPQWKGHDNLSFDAESITFLKIEFETNLSIDLGYCTIDNGSSHISRVPSEGGEVCVYTHQYALNIGKESGKRPISALRMRGILKIMPGNTPEEMRDNFFRLLGVEKVYCEASQNVGRKKFSIAAIWTTYIGNPHSIAIGLENDVFIHIDRHTHTNRLPVILVQDGPDKRKFHKERGKIIAEKQRLKNRN